MQISNWHLKCPECGDDTELAVEMRFWAELTPAGINSAFNDPHYLRDHIPCRCNACGHEAPLVDFKE